MDCRRSKGLILSDYTDKMLRGPVLEELESHLRSCSSCRRFAEEVVSTSKLLRSSSRPDVPQVIWDRIRAEVIGPSMKRGVIETALESIRYGLYHLRPAVVTTAAIVTLLFMLATARLVYNMNYSAAFSQREDIINMVTLGGDEPGGGEYNIGTTAETYFL